MRPINRRELIRRLRLLGFSGPYSGGRQQFMKKDELKLRIPNPHAGDISIQLLKLILKQAGITEKLWNDTE
ncbi:type II toxin-antitoxin system HicA family toxin [Desulfotruncus alcoholivorax]|uniref:type II toxin-antitoxin system HicA family toxin n=1 Tax=Desulfotruncus alcoholivorax TaxID=265477 RepID=UPI00048A2FFF|nr:type II toxin-antitoxin system HicA family toxin [Desulfotruncus alcoholivorax]